MGKTLAEIAEELRTPRQLKKKVVTDQKNKVIPKVQLIYAFNAVGKTRLSLEFKTLFSPQDSAEGEEVSSYNKVLYYNAFTEDLFYWDNNIYGDSSVKLKIQTNTFIDWVFKEQGQEQNIITTFQHYTNDKLTPHFNQEYSEITFSLERGNDELSENLKISKGEESCFIWSFFYTFLSEVISTLVEKPEDRSRRDFDELEYVFIDDPVSSLDENHLIGIAVDLAQLISKSDLKFIITTHNPLFYNVLHNELKTADKYILNKFDDGTYTLIKQSNDSPFSYHLYLKSEIEKAIIDGTLKKYHFNFLRNILEKTSTFLGYAKWGDLLPRTDDSKTNPYQSRIINISSHSKHASEETADLSEDDKRVLSYLMKEINTMYRFQSLEDRKDKI